MNGGMPLSGPMREAVPTYSMSGCAFLPVRPCRTNRLMLPNPARAMPSPALQGATEPLVERIPGSISALLAIGAAMSLPYLNVWLHGRSQLVAAYVERRRVEGVIPPEFLEVSRQVAENRVQAQGLIDAIVITVTIVVLSVALWVFARWRTVRLPARSAVSIAATGVWAEIAFYLLLYVLVWLVFGTAGMRLNWNGLVPTEASRLLPAGTLGWAILRMLTIGVAVRFVTMALVYRRVTKVGAPRDAWLISGAASVAAVAVGVFVQSL